LQHAKDELRQETGLIADKVTLLREYFLDPDLSRQRCMFYIAQGVEESGHQELDEEEKGLIYRKISLPELDAMITGGIVTDLWGYASIRLLQEYVTTLSV
jgi:8-oxo-dGTP pyrophosphatase MutT (NUDIX family)